MSFSIDIECNIPLWGSQNLRDVKSTEETYSCRSEVIRSEKKTKAQFIAEGGNRLDAV